MKRPDLTTPRFESGSYGERAAAFFTEDHEWEKVRVHRDPRWFVRGVTWPPYQHWIEQHAEEVSSFYHRAALSHRMFQVSLLSALRASDGLQEYEQWFIIQPTNAAEKIAHIRHLIKDPEAEGQTGEINRDFDFVMEHGFYVPNAQELAKLDSILEEGHHNGPERLRLQPKHKK